MADNLGNLSYTLTLDDSKFNKQIDDAAKSIERLNKGADIEIKSTSATTALETLTNIEAKIRGLKEGGTTITINPITASISSFNATTAVEGLRTQIQDAFRTINVENLNISDIKSRVKEALSTSGVPITLTCNNASANAIITQLQDVLKGHKFSISIKPDSTVADIRALKTSIETKIGELALKGTVKVDASSVRRDLSNLKGQFELPVELKIHTNTVNAQLEKLKGAFNITLNNQNLNGNSASQAASVTTQINRQNKALTDQLGIRRSINDQMSRNTQLATMFGNTIGNVFATYQIQRFLEALVEVGGEIQKQRMALGHILGNDSQAGILFGQMKDLAVKSPFGLLDLMQNARQLSAFGVEYNNLYDTMKRLSDVAAGLGIQFGRLSLAYGETMERGFLDGKLVRQFSYMGLPVLQKIAEYYTEIDKHGNGSIISATDVRKMVSNREVSFEDLNAVINKMTDQGGQFFNMQEVMAESVAGKWKNVADAMDIMYSNITEGNSELLKMPAEILIKLTKNYEDLIPVLQLVLSAIVGVKAASALYTATMGKEVAVTYESLMAEQKRNAVLAQRNAALNGASIAEIRRLSAAKAITDTELAQLVVEGKLNAEDAKAIVLKQGVSLANLDALQSFGLITMAERQQILASSGLKQQWQMMGVRLRLLGVQAKIATAQFLEMSAAMLANPATWAFALVGAIFEIGSAWNRAGETQEKIHKGMRDRLRELGEDAEEIAKKVTLSYQLVDVTEKNPDLIKDWEDGGKTDLNMPEYKKKYTATVAEMQTAIDNLVKFIKDNMPGAQEVFKEAFNLDDNDQYEKSIEERYEILYRYYQKLKNLPNDTNMNGIGAAIESVFNEHWWNYLWNDDLLRDAADFEKNFNNMLSTLREVISENADKLDPVLKKWQKQFKVFNNEELFKKLMTDENWFEFKKFKEEIGSNLGFNILADAKLNFSFGNLAADWDEYTEELKDAKDKIEKQLRNTFPNFSWDTITVEQKFNIAMQLRSYLDNSEASEWVKNHMVEDFKTSWGIDISMSGDVDKAKDLLKKMYGSAAKDSVAESNDELQKLYNDTKKKLKSIEEHNLKSAKKNSEGWYESFDGTDTAEYKKAVDEANGYIRQINEFREKGTQLNIDLEKEYQKTLNKSKGSKNEDTWLKDQKEKFDELKKTYSEFKKWSEVVGKEQAGSYLAEHGLLGGFEAKDFADTKAYLAKIYKMIEEYKKTMGSDVTRRKYLNTLIQLRADIELDISKESIKRETDKVQNEINNAIKQYDIWKVWFDATGNNSLALQMSVSVVPVWNEKTTPLKEQLQSAIGDEVFSKLDWSKDADMNAMKDLFTGDLVQYFDLFKTTYDLALRTGEELSKNTANVIKNMMSYEEKVATLEEQRRQAIAGANGNADIIKKVNGYYDSKVAELNPEYKQFISAVTTMTEEAALNMANAIKDRLVRELADGTKSFEEYSKALETVDSQLEKSRGRIKSMGEAWLLGKQSEYINTRYTNARYSKAIAEQVVASTASAVEKARKAYEQDTTSSDNFAALIEAQKANTEAIENLDKATNALTKAEKKKQKQEDLTKGTELLNASISKMNTFADGLSNIADALEPIIGKVEGLSAFSSILSGATKTASGFQNLFSMFGQQAGIYGAVIGAFVGIISASEDYLHQQQQVNDQRYEDRKKFASDLYSYASDVVKSQMGGIYNGFREFTDMEQKALEGKYNYTDQNWFKSVNGSNGKSYYDTAIATLEAQYNAIQAQSKNYQGDTKDDKETMRAKVADYELQMEEIQNQIDGLVDTILEEFYSVDFKDWASQLGDALVDAWAKGENAAKAYEDVVQDLIKSLSKSIITQSIVELMLEEPLAAFKKKLAANSGIFDVSLVVDLANTVASLAPQMANAVTTFAESMKQAGYDMSESSNSSSTANSIKGVSEETADILAALLTGMRLDLSLQRTAVEGIATKLGVDMANEQQVNIRRIADKICSEDDSMVDPIAQQQLTQLQNIASYTYRNAEAAENIQSLLDAVSNGTKELHIA